MKRKVHLYRLPFYIGLYLLIFLVIIRALLPFWVRDYVNRKLSEVPEYRGHVAAVTLHLWRGAYQIHHVEIVKTTGHVPVPFFSAPLIDLSVQWRALFDGAFVGNIDFLDAKMNFVHAPSKENSQVGVDKPWPQKIKQLFPLKINRFTARNGEVHYRDFSKSPNVDVIFDRVQMVATNLTNSKKLSKTMVAELQIEGRPLRAGDLRARVELPLVKLNDFAKAYAGITFETGTLKLATEMTSNSGRFNGYVEPVFDHMGIFNPAHDSDNPIDFVWQGIVGGLTRMIRNQPKDRFGTKAPFSGSFDNPKAAVMTTIFNVFRNAFIQVFTGTLSENKQDLPKVDPEKKKE